MARFEQIKIENTTSPTSLILLPLLSRYEVERHECIFRAHSGFGQGLQVVLWKDLETGFFVARGEYQMIPVRRQALEEVECVAGVQVGVTQKVEETAELAEVRAAQPLSLSPGTFQSKTTFCFSGAVAEVV